MNGFDIVGNISFPAAYLVTGLIDRPPKVDSLTAGQPAPPKQNQNSATSPHRARPCDDLSPPSAKTLALFASALCTPTCSCHNDLSDLATTIHSFLPSYTSNPNCRETFTSRHAPFCHFPSLKQKASSKSPARITETRTLSQHS